MLIIIIFYFIDRPKATLKDIFSMYAGMRQGCRFIDVCLRFNPDSLNIDERNLVLYGLANGYVRQLRKVNKLFSL